MMTSNKPIPSKKEIKRFLRDFPYDETSPAVFEYSFNLYDEEVNKFLSMSDFSNSPAEREFAEYLQPLTEAKDIVNAMRKPTPPLSKSLLMQKLLEVEDEALGLIKEKCMSNMQDYFIENAVRFFIKSKTNCCKWILENYEEFRSEYLKSMFCIVIGFRGEVSNIPFLIDEAYRFLKYFPQESFEQAPALAVEEIANRYNLI